MPEGTATCVPKLIGIVLWLLAGLVPVTASADREFQAECTVTQTVGDPTAVEKFLVQLDWELSLGTGSGRFEFPDGSMRCGPPGSVETFDQIIGQANDGPSDVFIQEGISEQGAFRNCGLELIDITGAAINDIDVLPDPFFA